MLNRLIASLALAAAGLVAVVTPAAAATVNFEDLSNATPTYDRYANKGLTFSSKTSYWIYEHTGSKSTAGNYSLGSWGWENITGYFTVAVNSLSMLVGDEGGDFDRATLNVYDSANHLLASASGSGYSWFSLSVDSATSIARFEIIQSGAVAIDNLTFSAVTAANNVPEPGTLALAGLGMVGAALVRRRRQQA